eukprot:gene5679-6560_t
MSSASSSTSTRAIPFPAKDPRHDHMIDFSTSLGGTIYGTTPGGTKLVYDRSTLLQYRNSPLAKTPPAGLVDVLDAVRSHCSPANKQPVFKLPQTPIHAQQQQTQPAQPAATVSTTKTASTAKASEEEIFAITALPLLL